ncbi:murein DD-endopeptidase MepM/ murein hydrolase activator NlpD [Anaerosolibacter carboniphilus]|uniref:Murein DD-endopeptidase MepM/ murein hydrolase activator NlpD n=1 Tax=Anaerosolibacter carboniphilus TaxID=1417629 RepID=A0A841KVC9_9FIRM|nr:M23 family metallopeptidase [Anaerosolibacter carboniphilus]MBB6214882.1 murein DD-endopeptidase MepM/ murein hydrolase activator NlpD [Anaerosolibacter carboniphilus]
MNKSFGRMKYDRPRMSSYPKRISPQLSTMGKGENFYRRTLKKIAICIGIVLLAILMKSINLPFTNKAVDVVKTTLNKELDFKKAGKRVLEYAQTIPSLPRKAASVFNNMGKEKIDGYTLLAPIQGTIVSKHGENIDPVLNTKTYQLGIKVMPRNSRSIISVTDGEIIEVGESESFGKFIKIQHGENVSALYGNCGEIYVNKGENVRSGQEIAKLSNTSDANNLLQFLLWVNDQEVDPEEYINFDKTSL